MEDKAVLLLVHVYVQERKPVIQELFDGFWPAHCHLDDGELQEQLQHWPFILLAFSRLVVVFPFGIAVRWADVVLALDLAPLVLLLAFSRHCCLQVDVEVLPFVGVQNDGDEFGLLHGDLRLLVTESPLQNADPGLDLCVQYIFRKVLIAKTILNYFSLQQVHDIELVEEMVSAISATLVHDFGSLLVVDGGQEIQSALQVL